MPPSDQPANGGAVPTWPEHLNVSGLSAGYGKLPVIHDIDFVVGRGELVAILGPNGAGKSTLLKTLARVLPAMSGTIAYREQPITLWNAFEAARNGIGYLPQEHNVFPDLSVRENLEIGVWGREADGSTIDEVFTRFPVLGERSAQRAGTLSGGERQMLALSTALLMRPELLLLDEPTTGLSPMMVTLLNDWIHDISASGISVVWVVEQNPEPVLASAHRAYVLAGGQVRHEGDPRELAGDRLMTMLLEEH